MIPQTPENYRLLAKHVLETKLELFFPCHVSFTGHEEDHIIHIASSVMMTRDGVLRGGGFAQAIVDNDLRGAFDRADSIMVHAIRFMVYIASHVYLDISHPIFEEIETN